MKLYLSSLAIFFVLSGCSTSNTTSDPTDYREEMREFVIEISRYANQQKPGFIVIPQNGQELITLDGSAQSTIHRRYLNAIDAVGREDLFYGYQKDNVATPPEQETQISSVLDIALNYDKPVLVTNYTSEPPKMDDAFQKSADRGYVNFSAERRALDVIPDYPDSPRNENNKNINSVDEVENFLYLINPSNFETKKEFTNSISKTNYDLVIIDLFFHEKPLLPEDLEKLKTKANGGQRLVIAYMSIGEAEDYRYYWQPEWKSGNPAFLRGENPNWEGNYKVAYWDPRWQSLITGNQESYLQKIIDAGFDGVYLDLIDAFWFYENQEKNNP